VLEVAEGEVEPLKKLVCAEMAGAASLRVPLEVEAGHGRTWDAAH
jgi:DNA polymerase-1